MHVLTLKLIWHVLSVIGTLLNPLQKASLASQQSSPPPGAVNTPPSRQPPPSTTRTMSPSCEWSICVDDAITGEPRGLIFTAAPLSENEALAYARAILTTYRVFDTFFPHPDAHPSTTEGLYLFSYTLGRIKKLASIWAHSRQDAIATLDRMASCGNLLCYCEPDS